MSLKDLEFAIGDTVPNNEDYIIVDKSLRPGVKARPLGIGNAGIVYRSNYKGLQRAIKFLSPKLDGDKQARLSFETLEEEFEREIRLLSTVTHTNISGCLISSSNVS